MSAMRKPSFDPGFTENYRTGLSRIINPSGDFNVRRRGTTWRDVHPYLFMINTSWPGFMTLIFGGYVAANALFALIYLKLGVEHLHGADLSTPITRFTSAFFFSAQTFTTVGYGSIAPDGVVTSLVASFQALLGLMSLAIGTGLLFGRFSRPAARLAFSRQMLIAPYESGTSLQFRMANRRSNNLMELEVRIIMSTVEPTERGPVRKYKTLPLERQQVQFLPLTWTVVHPIEDSSPLWGMGPEDFAARQAEFLITIKAFDDTFFQTVHTRHSYRFEEVVWGAKFVPAFAPDPAGEMILDLGKLSEITPAENSPKELPAPEGAQAEHA
jgi:inward rectifier potassium channel